MLGESSCRFSGSLEEVARYFALVLQRLGTREQIRLSPLLGCRMIPMSRCSDAEKWVT